jgi:hypothetical protein
MVSSTPHQDQESNLKRPQQMVSSTSHQDQESNLQL